MMNTWKSNDFNGSADNFRKGMISGREITAFSRTADDLMKDKTGFRFENKSSGLFFGFIGHFFCHSYIGPYLCTRFEARI
jgi:hypothetical protein